MARPTSSNLTVEILETEIEGKTKDSALEIAPEKGKSSSCMGLIGKYNNMVRTTSLNPNINKQCVNHLNREQFVNVTKKARKLNPTAITLISELGAIVLVVNINEKRFRFKIFSSDISDYTCYSHEEFFEEMCEILRGSDNFAKFIK